MVDKLEVGKTYRCIDLDGYLGAYGDNTDIWDEYSINGCYTIDYVDVDGDGWVVDWEWLAIGRDEMKYFELVEDCNESAKTTDLLKLSLNYVTLDLTREEAQDIVDDLTAQLKDIDYGKLDGVE